MKYYTHRQTIMQARREGLTATYNRFHNPNDRAPDIQQLRELHVEMDRAVAAAYGWLDRLLALNHQRHEEEVEAERLGKELR
ncbi:MAG: hypothetical protein RKR03_02965 [Candidatus Competibacter sp.]|nr:hypothetical protein [Candidatus Competibacter sp.]